MKESIHKQMFAIYCMKIIWHPSTTGRGKGMVNSDMLHRSLTCGIRAGINNE